MRRVPVKTWPAVAAAGACNAATTLSAACLVFLLASTAWSIPSYSCAVRLGDAQREGCGDREAEVSGRGCGGWDAGELRASARALPPEHRDRFVLQPPRARDGPCVERYASGPAPRTRLAAAALAARALLMLCEWVFFAYDVPAAAADPRRTKEERAAEAAAPVLQRLPAPLSLLVLTGWLRARCRCRLLHAADPRLVWRADASSLVRYRPRVTRSGALDVACAAADALLLLALPGLGLAAPVAAVWLCALYRSAGCVAFLVSPLMVH